jgi:phosphoribosylformimino-5-aminoimidazole carboxamide ribotide isomerase
MAGSGAFSIVPVIDLKGGLVVRARAGERGSYAPIATPLAASAEPVAVVAGLVRAWPATSLYIADLDAIAGAGEHRADVARIAKRFGDLELWVDAGFSCLDDLDAYGLPRNARPVIGSESQRDAAFLRARDGACILSLDSKGEERLDPAALEDDPSLWPETVIVMTLARVGTGTGPDLERLKAVRARAPDRRVVAAGGVRDMADVAALAAIGIAGALVATALHDGRIRRPKREGEA